LDRRTAEQFPGLSSAMRIAVLHNPKAGDRDLSRKELRSRLRHAGYRLNYFSLKNDDWMQPGALHGVEFVVVAGGDGSVRRAVLHLHDSGLPLALLPLGTANNICTCLGIVGTPQKIIARWAKARRRAIDLGVAKGPWGEKLFVESAGVGLIGRTIRIADAMPRPTGHGRGRREARVHRDASIVLALAHELRPVPLSVALDGRAARTANYLLFEVMNINRIGPGFELAPEADVADGLLDIVSATEGERAKLTRVLAHAFDRPTGALSERRTSRLRLELGDGEFRVDDQVVWDRRTLRSRKAREKTVIIEIAVRPRAIEVLV
jgi:diacylglycerol kinase (ATP)